ncbi:MAG: hypothetical protein EOP86_16235 [Verrucomicrobiaceae bacterium]|nr:MAG: hypothetical protein EOP86_16235 [Verrucomicrobiaceae bacterium]
MSTLDAPVILQDVIPWTEQSTEPSFLRILAGIHPGEKASADEIRGDLRYAYSLLHNVLSIFGGWRESEGLIQRNQEALLGSVPLWRAILAEIPHEHLPMLIAVIKDDPWAKAASQEEYDRAFRNPPSILQIHYCLRKRAAELLQPADMPGILADPDLTAKLRPFLPASAVPETAAPQGSRTGSGGQKPDR